MRRKITIMVAAVAATMALGVGVASALSVGDFIPKGDVQTALGLNNKGLQDAAKGTTLRVSETKDVNWTCTKVVDLGNGGQNEIVQQRTSVTTTYATTTARENSKGKDGPVTGFFVTGILSQSVDGPAVGSCPATPSGFTYDNNATEGDTTGLTYQFVS